MKRIFLKRICNRFNLHYQYSSKMRYSLWCT